ncbi:MAG: PD-(D/E)XK nuclease family transposase [Bacteroidaceae bacterium]|nr:PD-(D/E)XK nuclease family transposase [Bacteroidaceae bacterium]
MARYIRFDWAMKKLLRDKANFVVLEGFISTLLEKDIRISHIIESESNRDGADDKQDRVDVAAEDEKGVKYIIEVQAESEVSYFQRILFGTSEFVRSCIKRGESYGDIKKIYSINIVYFNLGKGEDYVYHGTTEFRGIHTGDLLNLSPFQQEKFGVSEVSDIFPEYYILKVNGFNDVAKTPLQEWIQFLKNETIPETPTAKGLKEAKKVMAYTHMTRTERAAYDKHLDNVSVLRDNIITARGEGRIEGRLEGMIEGRKEGREEGREEGRKEGRKEGREEGRMEGAKAQAMETARRMKAKGMPIEDIAEITDLSAEEIAKL